jgi:hypothetical protein
VPASLENALANQKNRTNNQANSPAIYFTIEADKKPTAGACIFVSQGPSWQDLKDAGFGLTILVMT